MTGASDVANDKHSGHVLPVNVAVVKRRDGVGILLSC